MRDLLAAIMNMDPPEGPSDFGDHLDEQLDAAYKRGFRDARHAAAELVSAALSAPTVPPGFVLVPVEPTLEMLTTELGVRKWDGLPIYESRRDLRPEIWRAMLSAAPSAKEQTP